MATSSVRSQQQSSDMGSFDQDSYMSQKPLPPLPSRQQQLETDQISGVGTTTQQHSSLLGGGTSGSSTSMAQQGRISPGRDVSREGMGAGQLGRFGEKARAPQGRSLVGDLTFAEGGTPKTSVVTGASPIGPMVMNATDTSSRPYSQGVSSYMDDRSRGGFGQRDRDDSDRYGGYNRYGDRYGQQQDRYGQQQGGRYQDYDRQDQQQRGRFGRDDDQDRDSFWDQQRGRGQSDDRFRGSDRSRYDDDRGRFDDRSRGYSSRDDDRGHRDDDRGRRDDDRGRRDDDRGRRDDDRGRRDDDRGRDDMRYQQQQRKQAADIDWETGAYTHPSSRQHQVQQQGQLQQFKSQSDQDRYLSSEHPEFDPYQWHKERSDRGRGGGSSRYGGGGSRNDDYGDDTRRGKSGGGSSGLFGEHDDRKGQQRQQVLGFDEDFLQQAYIPRSKWHQRY